MIKSKPEPKSKPKPKPKPKPSNEPHPYAEQVRILVRAGFTTPKDLDLLGYRKQDWDGAVQLGLIRWTRSGELEEVQKDI